MAVDPNIKKKADDIRNKIYGKEVRESLASGLEKMSSDVVENEGRQSVVEGRQDSVESQWQSVIDETTNLDVVSAPEIIAARNGESNLKARLDKENQEVTTQLAQKVNEKYINQENFVNTLKSKTSLGDTFQVYCQNKEEDIFHVQYPLGNNKAIAYTTKRKTLDDYILLYGGRVGSLENTYSLSGYKTYDNLGGNWNTGSPGGNYTTETGAYFEGTVTTAGLDIWVTTDNRGGIFDVIIDGDEDNPICFSTWADSSSTDKKIVEIFRFDEVGTHHIKGIFRGADSANPPVGGTARGWLVYEYSHHKTFALHDVFKTTAENNTPIFYEQSNKEFAFLLREQGVGIRQFVPTHGGVNTAHYIEPPKFIVDGIEKTFNTGDVIEVNNDFSILQKINVKNPDNPNILARITTIISFKSNGEVSIDGKFEPLVTLETGKSYNIMTPITKPFTEKVLTSIGNVYPINKPDDFNEHLSEETDKTTSFLFLSAEHQKMGLAVTYNNPRETLRQNADNKPSEHVRSWIQHRSDLIKLYQQIYDDGAIIEPSEVHRWSGTFYIGYYDGLYDLF